jgi:hypothetical protein
LRRTNLLYQPPTKEYIMSKLPPGLSMKDVLDMPLPGDITVGEAVAYMHNADWLKELAASVPGAKRFVITFRWRHDGRPLDPETTLQAAQLLAKEGKVVVSLDIDRGGGVLEPA